MFASWEIEIFLLSVPKRIWFWPADSEKSRQKYQNSGPNKKNYGHTPLGSSAGSKVIFSGPNEKVLDRL